MSATSSAYAFQGPDDGQGGPGASGPENPPLTPIPEPSSFGLIGAAMLAGVIATRRSPRQG
ncbi:MAG: PEP-CTERM sorting domain-containing protein [Verrucomicrobia bacterium]|nr:MAG: PEP-CTERM sorting domain-containing protein [Verrucomicrobiota bacterium]